MNDKIFRKKSVEKMSSPEQLNDYIKVTNPGVWIVLSAIVVLLIGVCVWGVFGKLETKISVACESHGGEAVLYIKEKDISSVKKDMTVSINGNSFAITSVSAEPVSVTEEIGEYARRTGNLSLGEWVYTVKIDKVLPEGVYSATIVVDSVSPLHFVFN